MGSEEDHETLRAALVYAGRGWPLFPCHPGTKQPLVAGGFKAASTAAEAVTDWWSRSPKAMIGVPTGVRMGAFVIDIDAGEDPETGEVFSAEQLLRSLEEAIGCALPQTAIVETPRGGRHLYFKWPRDTEVRSRTGLLPRIDVRGEGGYVVVPPSVRHDGVAYVWLVGLDIGLAEAPRELIELILGRRRAEAASAIPAKKSAERPPKSSRQRDYALSILHHEADEVATTRPGSRNDRLFLAACRLRRFVEDGSLDESQVHAALERASEANGYVDEHELNAARRTIRSGLEGRSRPTSRPSAPAQADTEAPGSPADQPRDLDAELAELPPSDLGNARRFVRRHGHKLKYCPGVGWLFFNGRYWDHDANEARSAAGRPRHRRCARWRSRCSRRVNHHPQIMKEHF